MWMSLCLFVVSCVDSFMCMSLRMYDPSKCMSPLCIYIYVAFRFVCRSLREYVNMFSGVQYTVLCVSFQNPYVLKLLFNLKHTCRFGSRPT